MHTQIADAPTEARPLPDLDPNVGAALGDDIVLGLARDTKVARVKAGTSRQNRAWSMGGGVD